MEWIQEHPGWWKLICTPKEEHMNLQIMQQIIDELMKESFYEAIKKGARISPLLSMLKIVIPNKFL
jgi:hypothetical protein